MILRVLVRGLLAALILTPSMSPPSYASENFESSVEVVVDVPDLNLSDEQKNRLLAMQIFLERNIPLDEFDELGALWDRESNWRTDAANPNSTARGIPQAMTSLYPETWDPSWLFDPRKQIEWGLDYIANRYGTPSKALEHHDRKGWY